MKDTEAKAREYTWETLEKRCKVTMCKEVSCKPHKHKQEELHTRCRARFHCLRDGFIAGHDDAAVEKGREIMRYQQDVIEGLKREEIAQNVIKEKRAEIEELRNEIESLKKQI